ncbi:MAG TPA: phenylacetate--CoA ligase [Clostridiales bacterium]|nr:phenylacetate--CoA ligase [Clostridiales bacterium]
MNCFNEKCESMSREEMRKVQSERLIKTVHRVYNNVPFYKKKMDELGVLPGDIQSVDDITKLPFTTKQDLRDNYPFGLFAAPMEDVIRIHASSGTTGKPTVVGYTKNDIDCWAETMARTFACAGGTKNDIIQVAYGYGLFTGGLGAHYGAEKLGAAVIPISGGNTKKQIMLMQDFGTTMIACTPSYILYVAETMEEMGIDPKSLKLKAGCFGAEPWTDQMRKDIEEKLGILAIDIYGLSEIMGPGVSSECPAKCGLHVNEDYYIPEVIDPESLQPLGENIQGELVFTTVTKEALPLLRYRTRDISTLHYEKCDCGRTLTRMSRVAGRSDDMLIIRGVNVFPSQIESVLLEIGDTAPHYQIIVDRVGSLDIMEVQVEMTQEMFSDQVRKLEDVEKKIKMNLESTLGISSKITLVEPKTIQRSEGKAKRVIDLRKEKR